MRDDVLQTLRRVNESFYQTFAAQFSATRERLQPGVLRAVASIPASAHILDLGCGNGELARHLFRHGHRGIYVGLDLSETLLERARQRVENPAAQFIALDLNDADWIRVMSEATSSRPPVFDHVFAFAVLHHIPGAVARRELAASVRGLLGPQGDWKLSVWDFLASDRLRARILPWERAGLHKEQVEAGDFLIDWRRGGLGQRYVHHFSPENLSELAQASGFRVRETFRSDGENGRLGLYQVWQPARPDC